MVFRFAHGELERSLALGAVTENSVRVWLREPADDAPMASVTVDGRVVAKAILQPAADRDQVAAAELQLGAPAPNARFTVRAADAVRQGQFAPTVGEPTAFAFAFGSCHQPFARQADGLLVRHAGAGIYPAMAAALRARGARFLMLLGDQIYSGAAEASMVWRALERRAKPPTDAVLRAAYHWLYRGYFGEPGFRALLEGWPTYCIWDDHDIVDGWGSLLQVDDFAVQRWQAARQAYRDYQHLRNPGATVDDEPPYHYGFWYGDVGFFVLDLRGERDYRRGVLLGKRQWRDLDAFLATASAGDISTLFVGCTVPLVHFSPALLRPLESRTSDWGNGARDRWSAAPFRAQRDILAERLFAWQTARPERQVILLSGDIHAGAAFRLRRRRGPGRLLQWTSSPLSTPISLSQHLVNRVGTALVARGEWRYRVDRQALVPQQNCGLVDLTPLPSGGHQVGLTLYAYDRRARVLRKAAHLTACPRDD